ncbi:uncharacterized protein A1O9_05642 [Exophiala aquamarina CBS 119918]|uniref:Uncharacterized protein n=1 Tax=Exophiala aquamarina CBS 119918 TaxID=1182545 RepID=A0A072PEL2_9EURO|nr:uncharacterized protein A1O9_05642 [Exophiala aquamarina CBS 119918]KEF57723.1 hypothetical protein A1O9_05642 [Exophiala aquamarina CBS 119918]
MVPKFQLQSRSLGALQSDCCWHVGHGKQRSLAPGYQSKWSDTGFSRHTGRRHFVHFFESASIMENLVERCDTENTLSYPRDTREYYQTKWYGRSDVDSPKRQLFFHMAGIGPM